MKARSMSLFAVLVGLAVVASSPVAAAQPYEPTWASLDARPTPDWFADAKFGVFIHWGVYSVPAWGPKGQYSEWYWSHMQNHKGKTWKFHVKTYGAEFRYQDFAPMWKAEMFDAGAWADLFVRAGAKYVVMTSKHHEGFCLWPSEQSWNWNSVDIGPHRDLCAEYAEAIRAKGLKMGFYYSLYEWFNPTYRTDLPRYVDEHMLPQMKDLVTRYKPDIVWTDGEWKHPPGAWRSREFLAWLFNESPVKDTVAVNDRWGKGTRGHHGGYYTTEYMRHAEMERIGKGHPWEECRGIGASFGYNRNEAVEDYDTVEQLVHRFVSIVAMGGNLLLDVGPAADGRIPVIMQQRLVGMGEWLAVNGEAIYGTRAWRVTNEGEHVFYTTKGDAVYAICTRWPGPTLTLASPEPAGEVTAAMIGVDTPLTARVAGGKVAIDIPPLSVADVPCRHAWVIKLTGVK
jgi:alpha-L-fucosidase